MFCSTCNKKKAAKQAATLAVFAKAADKATDKATDKAASRAQKKAGKAADTLAGKASDKAAQGKKKGLLALAGSAAATASVAHQAQEKAQPLVEAVQEKAQPLVETVHDKAAPVVEKAHDTLVDEILPRLTEALSGVAASTAGVRDAAAEKAAPVVGQAQDRLSLASDRSADAYAVLKGEKVAAEPGKRRSGTALMVLGLLAAGAAAALTAYKQMQPQDDPWATPLLDPYTPPAQGRGSSVATSATGSQGASEGTVSFSADEAGTNAELSPAEVAQGGSTTSILEPVGEQDYAKTSASDAERTPADDGAGQLLDETESFERDENGTVTGDEQKKTF